MMGDVTTVPTCNWNVPLTGGRARGGSAVTGCGSLTSVLAEGLRYCKSFDWSKPSVAAPKSTTNVWGSMALTVACVASLPPNPVPGFPATGAMPRNQVWIWAAVSCGVNLVYLTRQYLARIDDPVPVGLELERELARNILVQGRRNHRTDDGVAVGAGGGVAARDGNLGDRLVVIGQRESADRVRDCYRNSWRCRWAGSGFMRCSSFPISAR